MRYKNLGGDSGVHSFESFANGITVQFKDGKSYTYTNSSAGLSNVQQMKTLANQGQGLNAFINRNVRNHYETKF